MPYVIITSQVVTALLKVLPLLHQDPSDVWERFRETEGPCVPGVHFVSNFALKCNRLQEPPLAHRGASFSGHSLLNKLPK